MKIRLFGSSEHAERELNSVPSTYVFTGTARGGLSLLSGGACNRADVEFTENDLPQLRQLVRHLEANS